MAQVSSVEVPPKIGSALAKASRLTGTNFDYLLQTALRESAFDKDAKAQRSTATGLFQFVESTWIETLKEEGARLGLKSLASKISKNSFGNYVISDPATRAQILDLRKDPEVSALMAGAYAQRNENYIEQKIGRKPSTGEVYLAHFLGARDAAKLILLTQSQPTEKASKLFTGAAEKNHNIFYENGKSRTVAEVYDLLVQGYKGTLKQGVISLEKEEQSSWSTTVKKIDGTIRPLIRKATFSTHQNSKAGEGSIGAWSNMVGVQEAQGAADNFSPSSAKGKFTEIYTKK